MGVPLKFSPHVGVLCDLLGTLGIDNEIRDDDVRNRRRIGSRVSFSSEKTKVKQCVCFEETTSFGSLTSCSCYGFQKTPNSASN